MWMSRIDNLCHSGVSLAAFAPRIEMVRGMFILSSVLVAALTVAWSATPVLRSRIREHRIAHSNVTACARRFTSHHCTHPACSGDGRKLPVAPAESAGSQRAARARACGIQQSQRDLARRPEHRDRPEQHRGSRKQCDGSHHALRRNPDVHEPQRDGRQHLGLLSAVPARRVRPRVRALHPDGVAVQPFADWVRQPGGGHAVAGQPRAALDHPGSDQHRPRDWWWRGALDGLARHHRESPGRDQ